MATEGDTFLPRIQSIFYATFDLKHGPKIDYQVPEGLIATPTNVSSTSNTSNSTPLITPSASNANSPLTIPSSSSSVTFHDSVDSTPSFSKDSALSSRASSFSVASPTAYRHPSGSSLLALGASRSPNNKRSTSQSAVLFNFDDISKYVIPPSALCGRLVICAARNHRIIGFPVALRGKYERNYFRYNLCFVFDRTADLSCYEPIVRKVSRVLTNCEEESSFLSSPETSSGIYAVLEQLYEDLNSYAETSIELDPFNSIELKIFPSYPNPPPVTDWMVPVALIGLTKRIEPNWDLTMAKVVRHIDGVNHVRKIAHLADCDVHLARSAIAHLLYYQVIMTIDIFQYSNIYALRKSIQWLAAEKHVQEECGVYVTKPSYPVPDWPKLLNLYSRLKDGRTVLEWMQEHRVEEFGIDARRFTSFGVIKGFLRRVHRYPVLLSEAEAPSEPKPVLNPSFSRRRGRSLITSNPTIPQLTSGEPSSLKLNSDVAVAQRGRGGGSGTTRAPTTSPVSASSATAGVIINYEVQAALSSTITGRAGRRPSAAERSLEQFVPVSQAPLSPHLMRHSRSRASSGAAQISGGIVGGHHEVFGRRHSTAASPPQLSNSTADGVSPVALVSPAGVSRGSGGTQQVRSPVPGGQTTAQSTTSSGALVYRSDPLCVPEVPLGLSEILDGEHHADELSTRFEAGWPVLKRWLAQIGGGKDENDLGRVCIIHR